MNQSIAIFCHDPECSDDCVDAMIAALQGEFVIYRFEEHRLNDKGLFENVDMVAFPGGVGDAKRYYDFFKRRNSNAVADFVANGGKYLGICMGAYWAGPDYFDLLDRLEPVQYIKRPNADVRRPYATTAKVDWSGNSQTMFFYDGCTFEGDGRAQIIGRYANNDPMAIIQRRVGLIGCHPESQIGWYEKKYMQKHWHKGFHNELLLEFTKRLMRAK